MVTATLRTRRSKSRENQCKQADLYYFRRGLRKYNLPESRAAKSCVRKYKHIVSQKGLLSKKLALKLACFWVLGS